MLPQAATITAQQIHLIKLFVLSIQDALLLLRKNTFIELFMSELAIPVDSVTLCNDPDLIPIAPQMRGAEEVRYGHVNNDDDAQATVTRLTDINSNPNSSTSAPDAPPIALALETSV